MTNKLYTKPENAVAAGYAEFNRNPHLAVDVPDGGFTITAKTTEGKRITFAFQPYKNGGAPQCVDIQYHDGEQGLTRNGDPWPVFNVLGFDAGKGFDTRDTRKVGIACVLMDDKKGGA
jgi:hypothetical protein